MIKCKKILTVLMILKGGFMKDNFKSRDYDFKQASLCSGPPGRCVQISRKNGTFAIRDSKNLAQAPLCFDESEWSAFVSGIKNGEFDV